MKKRKIALAAGIAASLMLAAGCSNQASTGDGSQAAESQTEASKQETESETPEENGTEAGENAVSKEEVGLADEFHPLKIWGTITEVTDHTIAVDNQSEFSSPGEISLISIRRKPWFWMRPAGFRWNWRMCSWVILRLI